MKPRDTHALVRQLANEADVVAPLRRPGIRALAWFGISAPMLLLVSVLWRPDISLRALFTSGGFLIEEAAAIATSLAAAAAALAATVPGQGRGVLLAPIAPLAVWIAAVGREVAPRAAVTRDAVLLAPSEYLIAAAVAGVVPALAMAIMLRRGAPVAPHIAGAFGGLAVGMFVNAAVRVAQCGVVSSRTLAWNVATIIVLPAAAAALGRALVGWRLG